MTNCTAKPEMILMSLTWEMEEISYMKMAVRTEFYLEKVSDRRISKYPETIGICISQIW